MRARVFVVSFVMFAVAAALGAGFALIGPVALIRILGTIAFLGGAAGCALQLYALHAFAPRAYALLVGKLRNRYYNVADTLPSAQRTVLASYR
jgi:hypothetical protein